MIDRRHIIFMALFCVQFWLPVQAMDNFQIQDIEVVGARRVTLATVVSYMPVKVGDVLSPRLAQETLRSLYKTGFFKDVKLIQRGDILVVSVIERPAIASINIDGNSKVKKEDIEKAFEEAGLTEGQIYNDTVLEQMKQELQRLYYSLGRYGVNLKADVTPLARNRVKIDINIAEGLAAKIKQINIVGNTKFGDEELLGDFKSGVPHWLAIFSSKDEYSKNNLSGDLETLSSYYLDRGYANFRIESTQVTITPDKKDIYITINVHEGDLYLVRDVKLSGKMVISEKLIQGLVDFYIRKGEHFSRHDITRSDEEINKMLGNYGYAFSEVNVVPEIDEITKEVDLVFNINPGKRVYIRRISFVGNEKTLDEVYRRELRQMEGSWYAANAIERSKVRIERLSYVEEASVDTPTVPGTDDQVDVIYKVKERLSGSFNIGAGYSDYNGVSFMLGINQNNLFGTGNGLSLDLQSSEVVKSFNITHINPFFTQNGVSRSTNLFFREIDTERTRLSSYVINSAGMGVSYSMPVSEFSAFNFGLSVASSEIKESRFSATPPEIRNFIDINGNEYKTANFDLGYVYDSRNRTLFATSGSRQGISMELVPGKDLQYYKLSYRAEHYWPVTERTAFMFRYDIGFGKGFGDLEELPFFEKFTAGGVNSLRGFESRSIGPKEATYGRPFGGDLKTIGTLEYILPQPAKQPARISLFLDIGNVYETIGDFEADELRASFGITARWLTPMGALIFSLAEPIKYNKGVIPLSSIPGYVVPIDEIERFQFSVGGFF